MGSYSDYTSDLDEELPVFDFLQPNRRLCQDSEKVERDGVDPGNAAVISSSQIITATRKGTANVMMISSDSDDDDGPYIPLAQRLKQKQNHQISAAAAVTNGKHSQEHSASSLASAQLGQVHVRPSINQERLVNPGVLDGLCEEAADPSRCLPPKPLPGAGLTGTSPAKARPSKRTAEEIQASREEALKRRDARQRQQRDKEALRQEQERQKAEKRALSEAAKALRPEECIKHIVAAVDPGKEEQQSIYRIQHLDLLF